MTDLHRHEQKGPNVIQCSEKRVAAEIGLVLRPRSDSEVDLNANAFACRIAVTERLLGSWSALSYFPLLLMFEMFQVLGPFK